MKTHVHAELIKAWADGAEIEYFCIKNNKWISQAHPDWLQFIEYRIKPEIERLAVETAQISLDKNGNVAVYNFRPHNIMLTFYEETGKLKSAEVI